MYQLLIRMCISCCHRLDSYNRIVKTEWLINNKNLFLTVVEAEKSKIKLPADSVPGEGPNPGS